MTRVYTCTLTWDDSPGPAWYAEVVGGFPWPGAIVLQLAHPNYRRWRLAYQQDDAAAEAAFRLGGAPGRSVAKVVTVHGVIT